MYTINAIYLFVTSEMVQVDPRYKKKTNRCVLLLISICLPNDTYQCFVWHMCHQYLNVSSLFQPRDKNFNRVILSFIFI